MAVGACGKAVGVGKNERGGMHGVLKGGLSAREAAAGTKVLDYAGWGNRCPKRAKILNSASY